MPKMAANIAISRTTRRFLKQRATNWSIIEPHRAFHHHPLARSNSAFDRDAGAFLISDLDSAALESPIRNLDEHARPVIGHQERRRRHYQPRYRRRNESCVSEHVGFEDSVRIIECDADLVAPRIRLHDVADEQ